MWQLFTEGARRVILLAQQESAEMKSGHVGTEHLLLGLVRENEGVAAQILRNLDITLPKICAEIENEAGPSSNANVSEARLTPKAKRVLELAADEARHLQHNYIGTEHLLLALFLDKDGLGATVLKRLGLNLDQARMQVELILDDKLQTPLEPAIQAVVNIVDKSFEAASAEAQIKHGLQWFVINLNLGTFPGGSMLILDAREGWFGGNVWVDNWNRFRGQRQIQLKDIAVESIENEEAVVSVSFRFTSIYHDGNRLPAEEREAQERLWTEKLRFRQIANPKGEKVWRIVPAEKFPRGESRTVFPLLNQAAFALSQKNYEATLKSPATRAINHLKHLRLAAIMINADFGSLVFAPQFVKQALTSYLDQQDFQTENLIPSSEVFAVPDSKEEFCFNSHLSERTLDEIPQPEQTVLFYDGASENLVFRYDGQAAIAFVNGHCRLISPEEAQTLIWKP